MNSQPVVSDTSGFVSLANSSDSNHVRAKAVSVSIQEQHLSLIVPGEVITETVNVLGKKINHEMAERVGKSIIESSAFTIIETTPEIRKMAFKIFSKQPSSVSFTDCLVMAIADFYDTIRIFGYDDAFRKNGYLRIGVDDQT